MGNDLGVLMEWCIGKSLQRGASCCQLLVHERLLV